jgi:iron complex outermembrane receptor protein
MEARNARLPATERILLGKAADQVLASPYTGPYRRWKCRGEAARQPGFVPSGKLSSRVPSSFWHAAGMREEQSIMLYRNIVAAAWSAAALGDVASAVAADRPVTTGEPVIVTATRFGDAGERFPIGVQVITAEDIRRSTAATVPELLRTLSGIRTRDLSGSPNLQVDMRGFGIFGDQNTLVLLDGVRISEYEQTPVNWAAIPLDAIERIEVLRGSGAVLYGSGATGGTINIITRVPRAGERSASVYGGAGSFSTYEARAGLNLGGDGVGLRANAGHYESDNYRDNNRVRIDNFQGDARWWGASGALSLKFGADDQRQGFPGAITEAQIARNPQQAATPGDFGTLRSGYLNLGAETRLAAGELAANLGYREKDTDASFFVTTPFRNNVETTVRVWSFSPRFKLPHGLGGWANTLVIGYDYEDWDFNGTAGPSIVGRPESTQRSSALYFQHTTAFSADTSLALSLREQQVKYAVSDSTNPLTADGRKHSLTAWEIAARQRLAGGVFAYGKVGRSFRVPNVNDNYSLFFATVTLLEPQTSDDYEIGVDVQAGPGRYRFALYQSDIENEIFFDPLTFSNRNLQPTRRSGLEAEGRWQFSRGVDLFANYTYANAEFRSGSFGGVPIAGNRVPLVPRHAANVGVGWEFAPRTRLDAALRYVGEQVFDADETNTFGRRMPSYTVVDLKLAHATRDWRFTATVKNLFNEHYFTYGVFTGFPTYAALPAAERSIFVSAQYTFK